MFNNQLAIFNVQVKCMLDGWGLVSFFEVFIFLLRKLFLPRRREGVLV
jgi:hypothetical protein